MMRKFAFIVPIIVITITNTLSQNMPEPDCTPSHERAYFSIKFFLTSNWQNIKQHRIKSETDNIPIEQISHLDNTLECTKLDSILNTNQKIRNAKSLYANKNYTIFFYQTDNFYYVFWEYINLNEVRITGQKEIFIIVNKLTDQIYTCYI